MDVKQNYQAFLLDKVNKIDESGFVLKESINPMLFDFQADIVRWALRKGKAAIFADCGLGKTSMQLEWAKWVCSHTKGDVIILAPLAVSEQTVREGLKFGIPVNICKSQEDWKSGINITNYEKMDKFDPSIPVGIVLDESSILKSYSGKIRNNIISKFANTPYKLACTATPSPNDYMELGNHAEFLNIMSRSEMLAMYFIHDGSNTSKWRLKGHVKNNLFWRWMCQWAIMITKPSDLGYDDGDFLLPSLNIHEHFIKTKPQDGLLFVSEVTDLMDRRRARKASINERVSLANELIEGSDKNQWLVWCNLNEESDKLKKTIQDSTEVKGSDSIEHKEKSLVNFADNNLFCLVSKTSIAGFGMNFQSCSNMVFVGLSDSYESIYQAIRRCWRFGQKNKVNVHIVLSDREGSILNNIKRKEKDHKSMIENMVKNMSHITKIELNKDKKLVPVHKTVKQEGKNWTLYHGDCVDIARKTKSNSIDYTVFSPPFASLYTYSDSNRDMGNSKSNEEFMTHFNFLIKEMYRTTRNGRLVSIHCMDIPAMKERDGYIGLKDFSGDLIKNMQNEGFVYHSRVTIWKDPLIEATRTKAIGLMHKQIMKDSSRCRQGLPDYVITFMKPGENDNMISHPDGFTKFIGIDEPAVKGIKYSHHVWRKYASPVWMDINQSNTMNKALARESNDERHIAPLQLDVIARCIELWSNPNDLVCSWFAGIGSEGYQALKMERRFIGSELKKSYFDIAVNNLKNAVNVNQMTLF